MKKLVLVGVICLLVVGVAWAEPPEPKVDWQLRALEAEVKVAIQGAQLAKALEEVRVFQSWMQGRFQAEQKIASAEAQQALREYRKTLKEVQNEKEKPADN